MDLLKRDKPLITILEKVASKVGRKLRNRIEAKGETCRESSSMLHIAWSALSRDIIKPEPIQLRSNLIDHLVAMDIYQEVEMEIYVILTMAEAIPHHSLPSFSFFNMAFD